MHFRYWLIIVGLLGALLAASWLVLQARFDAGKGMPDFSVYSTERDGLATAADVLRQLGFRPTALTRPIQNTHYRGLLIVAEPQARSFFGPFPGLSETDSRGMLDWVRDGNTLVLLGASATLILDELGLSAQHAAAEPGGNYLRVEVMEVGGYTEPVSGGTVRVRAAGVEGRSTLRGGCGVPLWLVDDEPGAVVVPHGAGRVIVIADPSVWTHRGLVRADNVLLLYNIARLDAADGRVFFDEYHHGIQSGGSFWDYLRYHDLHWIGLQLLLLAGAGFWAVGVRLGPAVPRARAGRADAVAYASAVARIYQRAGVLQQMVQHIARDFLDGLTRHLHLRRQTSPGDIVRTWRQRHGAGSAREVEALVKAAEALREVRAPSGRYSRRDLLHWARAFDAFLKETAAKP